MLKKIKDPLILSFLILIIAGGIFGYLKYKNKIFKQETPNLITENIETVNQITISNQEEIVNLKKDGEKWLLKQSDSKFIEADQNKIKDLLNNLKNLKQESLVSTNPKNHEKYGVTAEKAINLKLATDSNQTFKLLVGYADPSYSKDYIRLPNDDKVFLSNLGLRSDLMQPSWKKAEKDEGNQPSD